MSVLDTIGDLWGQRVSISADDEQSSQTGIFDPSSYVPDKSTGSHVLDKMYKLLSQDSSRMNLYSQYAEIEEFTPEVEKALNFYADYAASGRTSEGESLLVFKSRNGTFDRRLKKIDDVAQIGKQAWVIIRQMCQFGEAFYENIFSEFGLSGLRALPKETMFRIQDHHGQLVGFEQRLKTVAEPIVFEDFQVSHFRLRVDESKKYGRSILWSVRRLAMELALMDQAMTIERLSNAHRRLKVMVDVGNVTDEPGIRKQIDLVKSVNKQISTIDPKDGKMRLKNNPMRAEENVYIPTRKGSPADVDVLPSSEAGKHVRDLELKWERLFAGLGPPMSWYGLTGPNVRAVIKDQALNFMRTVRRVRAEFEKPAIKVYQIALMLQYGLSWERVYRANIRIAWPQMSQADDLLALELDELRAKIAQQFKSLQLMSRHDMLVQLFKKDPEEASALLVKADADPTISANTASASTEPSPEEEPGMAPADWLEKIVSRYPELRENVDNITMLIDEIEMNSGRFSNRT